ncbi:MAG: hypothetical protein LAT81_07785 [Oceanicaulis sp.]|nr:hypothetical protein [Oceanicaulis sp.]
MWAKIRIALNDPADMPRIFVNTGTWIHDRFVNFSEADHVFVTYLCDAAEALSERKMINTAPRKGSPITPPNE